VVTDQQNETKALVAGGRDQGVRTHRSWAATANTNPGRLPARIRDTQHSTHARKRSELDMRVGRGASFVSGPARRHGYCRLPIRSAHGAGWLHAPATTPMSPSLGIGQWQHHNNACAKTRNPFGIRATPVSPQSRNELPTRPATGHNACCRQRVARIQLLPGRTEWWPREWETHLEAVTTTRT
jgi:hypothetical protein